jgi:hypothetical protein
MKNTMKTFTLIISAALLFASCAKEDISINNTNTPNPQPNNYEYYNLNINEVPQFVGEIDGTTTQFVAGTDGVENVASVSYTGNNSTLATEFTVRENGNIIGKLVIAKRYINKTSLTDSSNVRQFFNVGDYGYSADNSNSGVVVTYIDQNNVVWTSKGGDNANSAFGIRNIKTAVTAPCSVVTYEVKTKIDLGCKLYNNGNSISISGSAIGQFAVAQ